MHVLLSVGHVLLSVGDRIAFLGAFGDHTVVNFLLPLASYSTNVLGLVLSLSNMFECDDE
jgi:hypothetical protein